MEKLLLLLTLAGVSYALQNGIHYKYKYYGSVSTGIPELSSSASGWAIKAEVNVYVEYEKGVAIFQLENVLTAEFNDDLGCDSRGEVPHNLFAPIKDGVLSVAIEHPFTAHLFDGQDISIEYIEDGLNWLVNLRKGIVSVFKNEVMKGNVDNQIPDSIASILHKGHVVEVFEVEEETLFGNCFVEYSLHRIPEHLAISKEKELKEYIEADDQSQTPESASYKRKKTSRKYSSKTSKKTYSKTRSKTAKIAIPSALQIKPTLWHVVRTVNFDRCDEIVGFQSKSIEGSDNIFAGQVDWRRSRSSVTEYILRGSPGHFRLEKAIVEGATTFEPFGFKTEFIQGRINQTYHLISATKIGHVPPLDADLDVISHSNTWMQETWSFAAPPKYSKPLPWVHYTGVIQGSGIFETFGFDNITDEQITNMKNLIIEKIKEVSLVLTELEQENTDTYGGSPSEDLLHAAWFFKFLPKGKVSEIFEHFFDKDLLQSNILARKLIIDTAAASGSRNAINTILDYIKQGKIPDLQIITFLATLPNNIDCIATMPNILDWILTLDIKEKPFVTTTALVSFANIMSELCVLPNARNLKFAGQMYGDFGCQDEIKDKFLPLLTKLIHDESDWVKIVGIVTLDALHSPFSFQILSPIIEGKEVKCSNEVRLYATYTLCSQNLYDQKQLREPIVDFLTGIYTDYGVNVALREAALYVVSTWRSDAAFFHSIARLSWREPSKRFASYITSLIRFYADNPQDDLLKESVQAASHAIKFARPTAPNHDYSQIFWATENDLSKHIKNVFGVILLKSKSLKHFSEIYSFMMYDFGGFQVIVSEFFAFATDLFVGKRILETFDDEKPTLNNIASKIAQDFYDRIEGTIKTKSTMRDHKFTLDLSWKLFNHIRYFLPLNKETISKLPYSDMTSIREFLIELTVGYDLVLAKFFNPFMFLSFQATEIGLPLLTFGSLPILLTDVSHTTLSSESKIPGIEYIKKGQLSTKTLSSFSTTYQTGIIFLLPWNQKYVQAGVKAKRDTTIPLKEELKGRQSNDGGHQNILHFDFESQYKKKFSVIKASNLPYTSIVSAFPGKESSYSFKKIVRTEPEIKHIQPFPVKYTGLELDLKVGSEISLPFTLFGGEDSSFEVCGSSPLLIYALGSPTVKFWEIDLTFDPEKSTTKKISFETMFGVFGKFQPESFTQERGDFYQYGQEGFDQYDQGAEQFAQKPSFDFQEGFQEIGGVGNPEMETLAHVNYGDSLQQRSQKMQEYFGGNVRAASLKVDLDGDEHRSYEILFSLSKSKPNDLKKIKKFELSFIRSPIPHVDNKPASVCIDVQESAPFITALDTFEGVLSRDLKKEIKAEITLGCVGKPVFIVKSSYELSGAWKTAYTDNLQEECDYDPFNPLFTLKNHAVYDQAKVTITWDKVCDPKRSPIASRLLDVTDNILGSEIFDSDCRDEAQREIKLNIHRCPIHRTWFIDVTRGESVKKFENIPHSPVFNLLFGVKIPFDNTDFLPSHVTPFNLESDKCIVGVDQVRTFDGFVYEYHPTQCWTVAYKDCFKNHNMLLVRSPQGESTIPEARYIDITKGLVIDFIRNTLRVNGKVVDPVGGPEIIKDEEEKVTLVKVYKRGDFYKLILDDDDNYIIFKDQIEILVDGYIWGHTCGLCGDSDGEPEAELIGPHQCVFSDPNLFVASWTAGSDTCDLYTLMEVREEVERYQDTNCHMVEEYEDHCGERNGPCIYYQWQIINKGSDVCVSARPLSYCRPECQIVHFQVKQYDYGCWPQDHSPEVLKTALANNETELPNPIKFEPYYQIVYDYNTPVSCRHY